MPSIMGLNNELIIMKPTRAQ